MRRTLPSDGPGWSAVAGATSPLDTPTTPDEFLRTLITDSRLSEGAAEPVQGASAAQRTPTKSYWPVGSRRSRDEVRMPEAGWPTLPPRTTLSVPVVGPVGLGCVAAAVA